MTRLEEMTRLEKWFSKMSHVRKLHIMHEYIESCDEGDNSACYCDCPASNYCRNNLKLPCRMSYGDFRQWANEEADDD